MRASCKREQPKRGLGGRGGLLQDNRRRGLAKLLCKCRPCRKRPPQTDPGTKPKASKAEGALSRRGPESIAATRRENGGRLAQTTPDPSDRWRMTLGFGRFGA